MDSLDKPSSSSVVHVWFLKREKGTQKVCKYGTVITLDWLKQWITPELTQERIP